MTAEISDPLSSLERTEWRTLRKRVSGRMQVIWEQYADLKEISDKRLYREEFKTFADYVSTELGMERKHAYRMMDAYQIRLKVSPIGDKIPEAKEINSEGQLRELHGLADDQLESVIECAAVKASDQGKKITAAILRDARQDVIQQGTVSAPEEEDVEDVEPPERQPASPKPAKLTYIDKALASAEVGNGILASIRAAIKLVKAVDEEPGTEMLVARQKSIIRELESAKDSVSVTIPRGACPRCGGKKCAQCGNQGWVNSILLKELEA